MPHTDPLEADDPREFGAYRPIGRLGVGGQGVVYLAEAPDEPGEYVAIKALHSDWLRDPTALSRLGKEVAAARRVASFCTARVVDADLDARPPYVVSEYIEGPTLLTQVSDEGPLRGSRLIRLAVGAATALTAIHQHGVVHRDFKPGNIILGPDGPRVIDFGIAREHNADATGTTGVVGTPVYMAPEHFVGTPIGPAADVFAWASTMVYAATGRGPFTAPTIPAIMNRVINDEPTTGELPEPLAGLVHRCLAKDPEARPTSRDVLLGLLADTGDTVPTDSPVYAAASRAAQAGPTPFGPPAPGAAEPQGGAFGAAASGAFGAATGAAAGGAAAGAFGAADETVPPGASPEAGAGWFDAGSGGAGNTTDPGAGRPPAVPPPAYGSTGPQGSGPPSGHYGDVSYGNENDAPGPLLGPTPVGPPAGFPSGPQQAGMPGPYGAQGGYGGGPSGPNAPFGPGEVAGGAAMPGGPGAGGPGAGGPGAGGSAGLGGPGYGPPGAGGPGGTGPGQAPKKNRKVLIGALSGVGALVIIAAAAFFVFGRNPDTAQAANETPQARATPQQTTSSGVRKDDVGGHGKSKAQQRKEKKAREKKHRAGRNPAGDKPSPKKSKAPDGKPPADPPAPKANRYTPQQACGSGYYVLESHPMYLRGARVATVYLLYNDSAGNNCAVTMRSDQGVGKTARNVGATLQQRGGHVEADSGSYLWYGGPVRLHAPGKCVRYGGSFTGGSTVSFTSPYGHCG